MQHPALWSGLWDMEAIPSEVDVAGYLAEWQASLRVSVHISKSEVTVPAVEKRVAGYKSFTSVQWRHEGRYIN